MNRRFFYALVIILGALALPGFAAAATLSVTPTATSVHAGDIVTVRLVANTQGTAINQGEGELHFPTDMLDVVSTSKAGSIFTLWVEEPSYSNIAGTMHFDGGVPTPGFNGSAGTVLSVTFHAKKSGTATLTLSDAALRANDGLGTDVLNYAGGGQITITESAPAPVPVTTPAPATAPSTGTTPDTAPAQSKDGGILNLLSTTHSDQNTWYQTNNPLMSWQLPAGATAVQTILDADANAVPSVTYKPAITEKRIANLEDGIWYFNIRARIGTVWGPVSSYALHIDTKAPELAKATFDYDAASQRVVISGISATDQTSGIVRYEISIDGGEAATVSAEEVLGGTYAFSYAKAGIHTLVLRAFDASGNHAETTGSINIPTPLANQTLWNIGGFNITFAWFIILILLISLLSLIAAATAWYKLYRLRAGAKDRTEKRDKLLHRSLRIYKEDLERHLRTLERAGAKRELTDEEADINEDLKKNVDDLERYLAKEFKKFD
jgi:hypothetical protein